MSTLAFLYDIMPSNTGQWMHQVISPQSWKWAKDNVMGSRRKKRGDEVDVSFMGLRIAGKGWPAMIIAIAVFVIAIVVAFEILI